MQTYGEPLGVKSARDAGCAVANQVDDAAELHVSPKRVDLAPTYDAWRITDGECRSRHAGCHNDVVLFKRICERGNEPVPFAQGAEIVGARNLIPIRKPASRIVCEQLSPTLRRILVSGSRQSPEHCHEWIV